MSAIKVGIQPTVRKEFELRDKAMAGDIVMIINPAIVSSVTGSEAWTRNVVVEIQTASGDVHEWINQEYATTVSITDDSSAGVASIGSTTLTLINGKATIEIGGTAALWDVDDTDTLTIGNITIMGYTVVGGTSIETFTA